MVIWWVSIKIDAEYITSGTKGDSVEVQVVNMNVWVKRQDIQHARKEK